MEENLHIAFWKSPIGYLKLTASSEYLIKIEFSEFHEIHNNTLSEILVITQKQLSEYFNGKRKFFNVNLKPEGSVFQKKIWNIVQDVPFGKTASYLEIAKRSGSANNTRAVGLANGKNPIPIIIPCHRIIGSNGKLTGYAGGIDRKKWLLHHELLFSENRGLLF